MSSSHLTSLDKYVIAVSSILIIIMTSCIYALYLSNYNVKPYEKSILCKTIHEPLA